MTLESESARQKKVESPSNHILELSETEFIAVARSNSISDFDEGKLKLEAVQHVMQYSLLKGMIPLTVSESIENPSAGLGGYVKLHIRLLDWAYAQSKLKALSISDNGGPKPSDFSNKTFTDSGAYKDLDTLSMNPNSGSPSDTLEVINTAEDVTLNTCIVMKEEHESQLGKALGDMCKGHSLSFDYYHGLEDFGCQTFPKLQKLAEVGMNKYCEPKID